MYNQYENYYTRNACSLVSLLMIMLYNYWIRVDPSFIMKVSIYFDKLWLWSEEDGAIFSIIYKGFVTALNNKLWLNFKIVTNKIDNLSASDKKAYGIWIKNYSSYKYKKVYKDWVITKADIDYLASKKWWIGHNLIWDWNWYFKDTNWEKAAKMTLTVLKYWQKKDIFWNNIRSIVPWNKETEEVCKLCLRMFQVEKTWDLDKWLKTNKNKKYLAKAKGLYFYWR